MYVYVYMSIDMNDNTPKVEQTQPASKLWLLTGTLAGVMFGLANLFMGKTALYELYSQQVIMIGSLLVGLVYNGYGLCANKSKLGYFWSWPESRYHDDITGGLNYTVILIEVTLGVILFVTGIAILLAFEYAYLSGVNQGVISTLFAITSIYLALIFWIFFKESMTIFDFVGMLMLVACALMIIFSKGEEVNLSNIFT